jgi:predicted AlkP superfamily pyrophosphatase or phosphodiesterase
MKKIVLALLLLIPIIGISQTSKPKLVVGLVVDQMRYDYLLRFKERFGEDGFNRLMKGLNCVDAHYNYVPTYTGPGHASIYTGFAPSDNGIVGNAWYSREDKKVINCVEDSKVKTIGTKSEYGEFSPKNLLKQTILEKVKEESGGKTISVSFKNRGAILPAGSKSDGVYWFDYSDGSFITSSYYASSLPQWVSDFNSKKIVDSYQDSVWKTMYQIDTYTSSRMDDNHYEVPMNNGKPVFPYYMKNMTKEKSIYKVFSFTPWANSFLLNFGLQSIKNEGLGLDEKTDFINISISSTDIAGHMFGPYSVEIEDVYLRLDRDIAAFLKALDKQVGKDNYVVFLTADHGVVSNPDYLKDQGKQGGYIETPLLLKKLESKYLNLFKAQGFIHEIKNNNIYFNEKAIRARKIDFKRLIFETKKFLNSYHGIEVVFERDSLIKNDQNDYKANMVKRGVNMRSGELIFLTKSGFLPIDKPIKEYKGTSHGSVWDYDTHVPLLIYGNGIPSSIRKQKVEITDIVPSLLDYLNMENKAYPGTTFKIK